MKILLVLVICLLVDNIVAHERSTPTVADFINWSIKHEKSYTSGEFSLKFNTFIKNYNLIQDLNELYEGQTEFALNQFADLTIDEFKSKILMSTNQKTPVHPKEKYLQVSEHEKLEALPDAFDWRDHGAVTPVKDQGSAGTCWAFSTVQTVEGQYFLKGNPLTALSVEQVVDCDGTSDSNPNNLNSDCGVYGGWPYLAFEFLINIGGIATEAEYPYCAGINNACEPCEAPGYNKTKCGPPIPYCLLKDSCQARLNKTQFVQNLKVVDWKAISTNETEIQQQLMNLGPLSIALNAELLQFYHHGIFNPIACNPQNLDHAVLLVGWGVDNSAIWGKEPYWIVKNSWGPKWGEKGYFRIARGKGKCGINTQVTAVFLQ